MVSTPLVLTADWQLTWRTLPQAKLFLQQILKKCLTVNAKHLFILGDLKDAYNPLDIRVTNWAVRSIQRFQKAGISVFILRGNHDRIGMTDDSATWFPVLKAAGAKTISDPTVIELPGLQVGCIPYFSDLAETRKAARKLAKQISGEAILLFHDTVNRCRENVLHRAKSDLSLTDLQPDKYAWIFGGHIHFQHQVGDKLWYVGSPFAQDWGETNQRKGFLVLTTDGEVKPISSVVPGLYDPDLPCSSPPSSWKGVNVRLRVPVDSKTNYHARLTNAKLKAQPKYPGATIHVEPIFPEAEQTEPVVNGASDRELISGYITGNLPEVLQKRSKELSAYLLYHLLCATTVPRGGDVVRFVRAKARNFLSFEHLELDFSKGITVISGRNTSWHGDSNGAGKTNLLQVIPVAIAGRTFKGQRADRWKRRGCSRKDPCFVELELMVGDHQVVIIRSRSFGKPKLQLLVGGKDVSSGIGEQGTQAKLEELTGLTWDILRTALFIDQTELNALLGGDAQRKSVFAEFLNLERFVTAQKVIKRELQKTAEIHGTLYTQQTDLAEEILRLEKLVSKSDQDRVSRISQLVNHRRLKLVSLSKKLAKANRQYEQYQERAKQTIHAIEVRKSRLSECLGSIREKANTALRLLKRSEAVSGRKRCPMCRQPISADTARAHIEEASEVVTSCEKRIASIQARLSKLQRRQDSIEEDSASHWHQARNLEMRHSILKAKMEAMKESLDDAQHEHSLTTKAKVQLADLKLRHSRIMAGVRLLKREIIFLEFAVKAFSRDGLPAFLMMRTIPHLNKAAQLYSELLSGRAIQVQFRSEDDGGILPEVINRCGGAAISDQSGGESRLASLIVSFAMRDVLGHCGLLVADEPGNGLDELNSRTFARGLRKVQERWGTVLVTSHNPYILAELAGDRQILVTKQDSISSAKVR